MRYRELIEAKWWDDEPTIRLYHGTSSAFVDHIRQHGLRAPRVDLEEYALEVLEQYIPRSQWTPELITTIKDRAARTNAGRAGDRGAVIYTFTDREAVQGYAESYAKHGGEIAYDVYQCACSFLADPDTTPRQLRDNPPLNPRFQTAEPVIVEIEVPKSWCIFDYDLDRMKDNAVQAWNAGSAWAREEGTLENFLDRIYDQREVRVTKDVPQQMIKGVTKAAVLTERVQRLEWPTDRPALRVWKNPSVAEIQAALASSQHNCIRGFVDSHTDVMWIWDAYFATHAEVQKMIGYGEHHLDDELIFLLSRDSQHVVDQSDWSEGEVYRTTKGAFFLLTPDELIERSARVIRLFGKLAFIGQLEE